MASKPLNLPQLAFAYKSGKLKEDDMPEHIVKKVKRFASEVPLDQLRAMAVPFEPKPREFGAIVHSKLRNVKSA